MDDEIDELKKELKKEFSKPIRYLEDRLDAADKIIKELQKSLEKERESRVVAEDVIHGNVLRIQDERKVSYERAQELRRRQDDFNCGIELELEKKHEELKSLIQSQNKRMDGIEGVFIEIDSRFRRKSKISSSFLEMLRNLSARLKFLEEKYLEYEKCTADLHSNASDDRHNFSGKIGKLESFVKDSFEAFKLKEQDLDTKIECVDLLVGQKFLSYQKSSEEKFSILDGEIRGTVRELVKKHKGFHDEIRDLERKFVKASRDNDTDSNVDDFIKQVRYNTKQLARFAEKLEKQNG